MASAEVAAPLRMDFLLQRVPGLGDAGTAASTLATAVSMTVTGSTGSGTPALMAHALARACGQASLKQSALNTYTKNIYYLCAREPREGAKQSATAGSCRARFQNKSNLGTRMGKPK